jgi:hypothetical protein
MSADEHEAQDDLGSDWDYQIEVVDEAIASLREDVGNAADGAMQAIILIEAAASELKTRGRSEEENSNSIRLAQESLADLQKELSTSQERVTSGWPIALTAINGALVELSAIL